VPPPLIVATSQVLAPVVASLPVDVRTIVVAASVCWTAEVAAGGAKFSDAMIFLFKNTLQLPRFVSLFADQTYPNERLRDTAV
jgi:hypothetical protein